MHTLLVLTWLVPLAAAALAWSARLWWLPAVAALPALAAAALVPVGQRLEIPWLLLGSVLGLDEAGRIFLAFTAVLWLAAGVYAVGSLRAGPHAARFRAFFLLAMAGNLWLIVGLDLASFYLGFGLMGLASYGLVVHQGDRAALRAGKVYLVMTIFGELAVFAALVMIAHHTGTTAPDPAALVGLDDLTIGLLILGLGIKAGLVPLHVWLPLAHPAAPVPASAVLSGAMIKVALLGWLRFLPVGQEALTDWGLLLVFGGLVTLFFAAPIGLVQSNPKVILAYSSVGKMGFLALALGLILLDPQFAPAGVLAVSLYAAHHALVKGGLFLGVGLRHHGRAQWLVLAGTLVLALSLAGVPPSSGAVAKHGVEPLLGGLDWAWLGPALTLSTVATALLMGRFLWVIWHTDAHPAPGHGLGGAAWGALVLLTLAFPLVLGTPAAWVANAWPVTVAAALGLPVALVAWRRPALLSPALGLVPPGDLVRLVDPILATLGFAARALGRGWDGLLQVASARLGTVFAWGGATALDPERTLRAWPGAGVAWLAVGGLLLVLTLDPQVGGGPAPQPSVQRQTKPDGPPDEWSAPGAAIPGAVLQAPERLPDRTDAEVAPLPAAQPNRADATQAAAPGPETGDGPAPTVAASEGTGADGLAAPIAVRACDPGQTFVFSHPSAEATVRLTFCVQGEQGPVAVAAPPLTEGLVALVQRHLNDLGYGAGPVDGRVGPRTRSAIRRFQQDHGIAPAGGIDFELLRHLQSSAGGAGPAGPAGRSRP